MVSSTGFLGVHTTKDLTQSLSQEGAAVHVLPAEDKEGPPEPCKNLVQSQNNTEMLHTVTEETANE